MNKEKFNILLKKLLKFEVAGLPTFSRIHALNSFPLRCFVKRDDELGFGLTGSKIRKYNAIFAYLRSQKVSVVIVMGSAYSNNVVGAAQLLIENGIQPLLFLKGDSKLPVVGNLLLLKLLVDERQIVWFDSNKWEYVVDIAVAHMENLNAKGIKTLCLPEGSNVPHAVVGSLTLAIDICRNEIEDKITFDRLFIDAGTGWTAATTLLAIAWMERETYTHVVLMAGDEEKFLKELYWCHQHFSTFMNCEVPLPRNFELNFPSTGRSFGSVNKTILNYVKKLAREEGFFTDPIYSGKLFYTAEKTLKKVSYENALIVHSGGALTLNGFQEALAGTLRDPHE